MYYQFWIFGRLVVALTLMVLAQADYIMDDTNSTIYYGPSGSWSHDNTSVLNISKLFDGTVAYSPCGTQNGCYMTIPFVGTGINVRNVIQFQMNASFTLDGDPPSAFAYPWDTRCFDPSGGSVVPDDCYNVSVYNAQSFTYGAHILNITMLSYLGPGNTFLGYTFSDFWFDYAVISTPTSPSAIPSSTGNNGSSNQRPHPQIAAAIGGAVGGGILIAVLTVLYYCKRRYRRQRPHAEVDPEPMESSFQPTAFVVNPPPNRDALRDWSPTSLLPEDTDLQNSHISPPPVPPKSDLTAKVPASFVATAGTSQYALLNKPRSAHEIISSSSVMPTGASPLTSAHFTEEQSELMQDAPTSLLSGDVNSHPNDISPPPNLPKSSTSSATAHAPALSVAPSRYSSSSQPSQPSEAEAVAHAFSAMSRTGASSLMGSRLTDEQSELVQGLLRHNVPLPAVVVVIEGMLRRDGPSGSGEGSGSQNTRRDGHQEGDDPPGYDFI